MTYTVETRSLGLLLMDIPASKTVSRAVSNFGLIIQLFLFNSDPTLIDYDYEPITCL